MAGFDHSAAMPVEAADERTDARNRRIGLVLCGLYSLLYGGFVLAAALRARDLAAIRFWGLNLAVLWGFALIVAAIGLSLVYGWLCRRPVASPAGLASPPAAEEPR
jgi:hypothetical protein